MNDGISVRRATGTKHKFVDTFISRERHLHRAGFPGRDSLTQTSILWLNGVPALRQL